MSDQTAIQYTDRSVVARLTALDLKNAHLHHEWSFNGPTAVVQPFVRVWHNGDEPVDISFAEFKSLLYLRAENGSEGTP